MTVTEYVGKNGNTYREKADAIKYGGGLVAIKKTRAPEVEILETPIVKEAEVNEESPHIDFVGTGKFDDNLALESMTRNELAALATAHGVEKAITMKKVDLIEFLKKNVAK